MKRAVLFFVGWIFLTLAIAVAPVLAAWGMMVAVSNHPGEFGIASLLLISGITAGAFLWRRK